MLVIMLIIAMVRPSNGQDPLTKALASPRHDHFGEFISRLLQPTRNRGFADQKSDMPSLWEAFPEIIPYDLMIYPVCFFNLNAFWDSAASWLTPSFKMSHRSWAVFALSGTPSVCASTVPSTPSLHRCSPILFDFSAGSVPHCWCRLCQHVLVVDKHGETSPVLPGWFNIGDKHPHVIARSWCETFPCIWIQLSCSCHVHSLHLVDVITILAWK